MSKITHISPCCRRTDRFRIGTATVKVNGKFQKIYMHKMLVRSHIWSQIPLFQMTLKQKRENKTHYKKNSENQQLYDTNFDKKRHYIGQLTNEQKVNISTFKYLTNCQEIDAKLNIHDRTLDRRTDLNTFIRPNIKAES